MKEIPLTQGKVALVDDEDYDLLMQWKWHFSAGYAGSVRVKGGSTILMHRVIMSAPKGTSIDHINGNPLDCRRTNLRFATHQQNMHNTRKPRKVGTTSRFKGVYWDKKKRAWRARIRFNYRIYHLGHFTSEIDAARAYNEAALKYFGEFARLNVLADDQAAAA